MRTDSPLLLPFACENISPALRHALRHAGMPCVNFDPKQRPGCRFVLTEQTSGRGADPASETVRVSAKGRGTDTNQISHTGRSRVIDVPSLVHATTLTTAADRPDIRLAGRPNSRRDEPEMSLDQMASMLAELKSTVESYGGVWARISDYPHAFRAAVCEGTDQEIDEMLDLLGDAGVGATPHHEIDGDDELHRAYLAGGLVLIPRGTKTPSLDRNVMPLLWRTNCREFIRWRRVRQRLNFSMGRHAEGLSVRCTGDVQNWRPTIEVWKQHHVATLPWPSGECVWKTGQNVWIHERYKHPAGVFRFAKWNSQAELLRYEMKLKQSA